MGTKTPYVPGANLALSYIPSGTTICSFHLGSTTSMVLWLLSVVKSNYSVIVESVNGHEYVYLIDKEHAWGEKSENLWYKVVARTDRKKRFIVLPRNICKVGL